MRRKPDMLWILAFLFGLGVVTTGYAQSFWEKKGEEGSRGNARDMQVVNLQKTTPKLLTPAKH